WRAANRAPRKPIRNVAAAIAAEARRGSAAAGHALTAIRVLQSWRIPLPRHAGEKLARAHHHLGIDLALRCEGAQQLLVSDEVSEPACKKLRLARGGADRVRADAGHRQEPAEALGFGCDEAERHDGEFPGCRLSLRALGPAARRFAFSRFRPLRHRDIPTT